MDQSRPNGVLESMGLRVLREERLDLGLAAVEHVGGRLDGATLARRRGAGGSAKGV